MKNQEITNSKNEILKGIKTIEKFNSNPPEGEVNVYKSNEHTRFQQRIKTPDGKVVRNYLSKEDKLLKSLAKKKYFKKLEPVITKELKALERQETDYWPNRKYEVYEELGELKEFVTPLFVPNYQKESDRIASIVKTWIDNNTPAEEFMEEGKKFTTLKGDKTRSKSEWMISAIFDQNKDCLRYVIEPEFYARGRVLRPDFEVISLKTGKIYYWEHVGMLGDEEYAMKFVEKINAYAAVGYFPGKNLLLTFESKMKQLDVDAVNRIIEEYFIDV